MSAIKAFMLQKDFKPMLIIGVLFFVFGFISWANAILVPYFKIICELTASQSMMVAFAFYVSYFVMAIPSSCILNKTGFRGGMVLGLMVMCAGAIIFIPASIARTYYIFLTGLFVQAAGMTILQSAVNPYLTILGPIESAAKRISVMGICNKTAGAIAPILLIRALTTDPDEIDKATKQLSTASMEVKVSILDQLGMRLIAPYSFLAGSFILLAVMVYFSRLPEIKEKEEADGAETTDGKKSIFDFPYLILGAICVFCQSSVEVLAADSIVNYAQFHGYSFRGAKFFASYILLIMIVSYLLGAWLIPKYINQRQALQTCALIGLLLTFGIMLFQGKSSVWFLCSLGLCNALLWPAIWPLALDGLGRFTKIGSALLIMGVAGGAVTPLVYGSLSERFNLQTGYWVLWPCYLYLFYYASRGYRKGKQRQIIALKFSKN